MATKAVDAAAPRRRAAREQVPTTTDSVEIALTAAAASGRPLPDVARRLLEEQTKLIHAQWTELRLRKIGEGVRAVLWGVLALAAALLVALIVAIVVHASRTDALVVQSFRVPPSLEAKGLNGEVVATQVLDKLAELQQRTESVRPASTYANNWENDLKIDIPNTGATADQVWKLLRSWLGNETRISGEVVESGQGLVLTARVGGTPGQRFTDPAANLDLLVTQGAEFIYKKTQPYRYSVYLQSFPERTKERREVLEELATNSSETERKWAYLGLNRLAMEDGDFRGALALARKALAVEPDMYPALIAEAEANGFLGHDQQLVDSLGRLVRLPLSEEYDARNLASQRCVDMYNLGPASRDAAMMEKAVACFESASTSRHAGAEIPTRRFAELLRNDGRMSSAVTASSFPMLEPLEAEYNAADLRLRAMMLGGSANDLAIAQKAHQAAVQAVVEAIPYIRGVAPVVDWPLQAQALSLLGKHGEAQALIGKTPLDCYSCVRVRGIVAQGAGDVTQPQRWFAEAVKQGPRLAPAYVDWARLLAKYQRFPGAEARFAKAAKLAPNWANPLKYWGDALAAQGKREDALAKYEAALKLAPNWVELRQARSRAHSAT